MSAGISLRIKKLFKGKKNLVISALDHVMFYGFQPGIEDERKAIENCQGVDALLLPKFMLQRNWDLFGKENSPVPIVRLNWSSSFYYPLDYREGYTTITTTVEEAVAAGAEAIICSLFIEEENDQKRETDNVKLFSEVVRQKEKIGIPLIGECYVVEHKDITNEQLHQKVKRITRVMTELGADLLKAFFTGERFNEVTENTPIPVFSIGAEKLKNDLDVLEKAYKSVQKGGRGVIFGRNIFMSKDPKKIIAGLNDVLNNDMSPKEALDANNL